MTSENSTALSAATCSPASAVELIANGYQLASHSHPEAQFMLVVRGLVTCEVAQGLWIVPPQCALWIPAGMAHSMRGVGALQIYCAYVEPKLTGPLPQMCCVLSVSALLREMVIELSHSPKQVGIDRRYTRLVEAMLDQIEISPVEQLHLPMPSEKRLRKIAEKLIAEPGNRTTISGWAHQLNVSERTLCRLMVKETGMSFGRWRQQLHILLALRHLSEGESVQTVAFSLGYESSSAFVAMFRKALGKPPLKFLAKHRQ